MVEAIQPAAHVGQLGLDGLQLPALLAGNPVHLLAEEAHEVVDRGVAADATHSLSTRRRREPPLMFVQQEAREEQRRFGLAVRRRRQSLAMSQEGLADVAGLHRTYVGSVERGERNVSLANIHALARALSTTPSELLADAEERPEREQQG